LVFGLALSGAANAQDQTIGETIEAGAAPDMAFVRCGGLYYAHLWWHSSKPYLSDQERAIFDANMNTALTQANFIRSEKTDAGVDVINEGIKQDLRPFIVEYVKRFERNMAASGEMADDLIRADRTFCDNFIAS